MRARFLEYLLFVAFIILLIMASFLAVSHAVPRKRFSMLGIARISILGNYFLSPEEVLTTAGIDTGSAKRMNVDEVRANLLNHRLIREAQVFLKGRVLVIRLGEQRPFLRVVSSSGKFWLCIDGTLIEMDPVRDFGEAFDLIRKQASLRVARKDQLLEPKLASLVVYSARKLEALAPRKIEEIRLDLAGKVELQARNGLRIKIGALDSEIGKKLETIPQILRAVASRERPVLYVEIKDPGYAIIKYST